MNADPGLPGNGQIRPTSGRLYRQNRLAYNDLAGMSGVLLFLSHNRRDEGDVETVPQECDDSQSARRAVAGSTRTARLDGAAAASNPTTTSRKALPTSVEAS